MLLFLYCAGGLSARASGLDLRSRGPAGLRAEREDGRPWRRPPTKPPSHAACQQPARAFLCWVPRSFSLFFVHSVSHSLDFFCVCVSSVRACACVRVCLVFSFEILTLCLRELERGMRPPQRPTCMCVILTHIHDGRVVLYVGCGGIIHWSQFCSGFPSHPFCLALHFNEKFAPPPLCHTSI